MIIIGIAIIIAIFFWQLQEVKDETNTRSNHRSHNHNSNHSVSVLDAVEGDVKKKVEFISGRAEGYNFDPERGLVVRNKVNKFIDGKKIVDIQFMQNITNSNLNNYDAFIIYEEINP